jgi:hypothetical protein
MKITMYLLGSYGEDSIGKEADPLQILDPYNSDSISVFE